MIFRGPNRFSDSVRDAESNDIKNLAKFHGNPTLEILIKIFNCVGGTKMRWCFLMKLCLITIFNCPVILGCFLV